MIEWSFNKNTSRPEFTLKEFIDCCEIGLRLENEKFEKWLIELEYELIKKSSHNIIPMSTPVGLV